MPKKRKSVVSVSAAGSVGVPLVASCRGQERGSGCMAGFGLNSSSDESVGVQDLVITVNAAGREEQEDWFVDWSLGGGKVSGENEIDARMESLRTDTELRELYYSIRFSEDNVKKNSTAGRDEDAPFVTPAFEDVDFGGRTIGNVGGGPLRKRARGIPSADAAAVSVVGVPERFRCYGKRKGAGRKCFCRWAIFRKHPFQEMLLVLDQVRMMRCVLAKSAFGPRAREAFNAVFGVTNVSTCIGANGPRGPHYYFHSGRQLGSICGNAMRVILTSEGWYKIHSATSVARVDAGIETADVKHEQSGSSISKLAANRVTHEPYSRIDVLVGYAEYLKEDTVNIPSVRRIVQCVIKSGRYQQPSEPMVESARKSGCSRDVKQFLEENDGSLRHNGLRRRRYFIVANPKKEGGIVLAPHVLSGHCCKIIAMSLGKRSERTVDSLNRLFLLRYGPDGRNVDSLEKELCLQEALGCKGLWSWSTGCFQSRSIARLSKAVDLVPLLTQASKFARFVLFDGEIKGRLQAYLSLSFKVNRLLPDGPRMQMPHIIVDPKNLKNMKKKRGKFMVRMLIPLDRAGLLLRIWPDGGCSEYGEEGKDRLVYVSPGTALLLPASVPCSDCLRFSPQGQRRVELVIVFSLGGRGLPPGFDVGKMPFYLNGKKGGSRASGNSAGIREEHYCDPLLAVFKDLFVF